MNTLKLSTQLVKPHFLVVQKQEQKNLVDVVLDELKSVAVDGLKLDPDFLKYLAEKVENQIGTASNSPDIKPNKMEVAVTILKRLFPLISDSEIDVSKSIIEFLLKNKLVQKVALSEVFKFYLSKKFFRPFKKEVMELLKQYLIHNTGKLIIGIYRRFVR